MREMLVFEDHPDYAWWLKLIYGGALVLTLALGIYFLSLDIAAAALMFGVTALDALLFRFVSPRSYQIYPDRLVVKLYGPFSKTIRLADIKSARPVAGSNALASGGIRFTTSTKNVLEIERRRGMSVIISPRNRELFLEQLEQVMKQAPDYVTGYR